MPRSSRSRCREGAVDIVGVLRWPEQPGSFVAPYSERQDLWFVRDHRAMAARYGWGEVAPFYVEMESPAPAGGVPRPGRLTVKLRNDHLRLCADLVRAGGGAGGRVRVSGCAAASARSR